MSYVTLWLSNGKKIDGHYDEGDFDGLFEDWDEDRIMGFSNCCVRGKDVVLIEYHEEKIAPKEPDTLYPKKPTAEYVLFRAEYEVFADRSYYDMWCVRNKDDRRFASPMSFHFIEKNDAMEFKRLIELAK